MRDILTVIASLGLLGGPALAGAGGVDNFSIGLEEAVSDGAPGAGAGNIEASGNQDVYTFTAAPGTLVFFEELSGACNIAWTCEDSGLNQVFSDSGFCIGQPGVFELLLGGTYTVTVSGENGATGTYSFIIWEVNPDDDFAIGLKQTVSDGAPGAGAGSIEEAGTRDVYTFNVAPGTMVFFDELSGACNIAWECHDSAMTQVFSDTGFCNSDPGTRELALGGDYTITVSGENSAIGTYSFVLWGVNATDSFSIGLEEVVAEGVQGVGAGNIEEAGTMDEYTFTAAPGTVVYFDELSGPCNIAWECHDSNMDEVFSDSGFCIGDAGVRELTLGGDYTITVYGEGDSTGTYSFIIWDVNPTQFFSTGIDQTVAEDVPGVGAGNIEEAGTMDVYTFNAAPGTIVFFDEQAGPCTIAWECHDANMDEVFSDPGLCIGDVGVRELTLGGEYTVTVFGEGDATGTYGFFIWSVEPPQAFAVGLDELVSDGFPGAGAGNIEEPGAIDIYTLEIASTMDVCFEEVSGPCSIRWKCVDAGENEIFNDNGLCLSNPGTFTLDPGIYTITVEGEGDASGTYEFNAHPAHITDFNGDCRVDVGDLLILLGAWGGPGADVTGDDNTDVLDLLVLLGEWG